MLDGIKKGIRGGICMISNRFSHVNNKYMKDYDPEKERKFITYVDANNLYGQAMGQKMPFRKLKWMNETELASWRDIPCILMVDLEYHKELHDLHSDYPLSPESMTMEGVDKLLPKLFDKKDYVIRHVALKQYLSLGLKLTKVSKGIKFEESEWLKHYIDTNTSLISRSKADFENDFFKLMNNSVFGTTMQNIENRIDVRLVETNSNDMNNLVSKDTFGRPKKVRKELTAIHMKKIKHKYDKPIYVGMSILDTSKTLLFDFHYNDMLKKYGDNLKLLFTDTDSLTHEIKTKDFYEDMLPDLDMYDTRDFPAGHKLQSNKNKKVIGKMKSEVNKRIITEFVGLRPKLYSFQVGVDHKKCKGVSKNVTKKCLTHKDYLDCLMTKKEKEKKTMLIRSKEHVLRTEDVYKIALSANDTKRVILEDGISTLARSHHKLDFKE